MALSLPKEIVVAEVGPRDGLQSFPRWIDTETKVEIVNRLSEQVAATATTVLEEVRAVELLHDHGPGREELARPRRDPRDAAIGRLDPDDGRLEADHHPGLGHLLFKVQHHHEK